MSTESPEILTKAASENRVFVFDFTDDLTASSGQADGEPVASLQGTPTVVSETAGLTIGTPAINTEPIVYPDRTIAIGKAVKVMIAGGSYRSKYRLVCDCDNDRDQPESLRVKGDLYIDSD